MVIAWAFDPRLFVSEGPLCASSVLQTWAKYSESLLGFIEKALRVENTSGMETVTGLVMGLAAREGDLLP